MIIIGTISKSLFLLFCDYLLPLISEVQNEKRGIFYVEISLNWIIYRKREVDENNTTIINPPIKKSFQVMGGTYCHDLDLGTCSWHVLYLFLNSLYVYLQKKQIKKEATKNLKKETEDEYVEKVIYKDKNKYLLGSLNSNDTDIHQMVMLYQNWCNIIQAFSKICLLFSQWYISVFNINCSHTVGLKCYDYPTIPILLYFWFII